MGIELDPAAAPPDPQTRVPLTAERVLLAIAMGAIALITMANVVTRYLTNISLAFTEEISVVLMVAVALLGTAYAMASGRHIKITYMVDRLPPTGRRAAEIGAMLLVIVTFAIMVIWGFRLAWDEYRFDVLSAGMGHPQWQFTLLLPVLSLVVLGRAAGRIVRLLRGELP